MNFFFRSGLAKTWGLPIRVLVIMTFLSGCAITMGNRFDATKVGQIEMGKTTEKEIKALFGSPTGEGTQDGHPMWIYLFAQIRVFGAQSKGTVLTVEFDDRGIVEGYSYVPY